MTDPERIGESFADQTTGPLPAGLGADGLVVRHRRRVRRRRVAGGVAGVVVIAVGVVALPRDDADADPDTAETVAETVTVDDATTTTADPVKVEEQTAGTEAQDEVLADGEVTEAEYEEAVAEYRACVERVDEADCYDYHLDRIDEALGSAGVPRPTVTAPQTEAVDSILIPGGAWTVTAVSTHLVTGDDGLIALATTDDGPYGALLRVSRDYGQPIETPDGVVEIDTPGQATVFVNRIGGVDIAVEGLGVDAATVAAVAGAITLTDGRLDLGPWPAGFTPVDADAFPPIQELIVAEGPSEISVVAMDATTRRAWDAIAGTRARSTTERPVELGLVTDRVTFVPNGDRLYLVDVDEAGADEALAALTPIAVADLRAQLSLTDRQATYDAWFAATPLPSDHGLDALRRGLTVEPAIEGVTAHVLFQCAWIDRWVTTGDPSDLAPLDTRDEWPTAQYVAAVPDDERALFDVGSMLVGAGGTPIERADDPAAQVCARAG